jgi:hypothetical protein
MDKKSIPKKATFARFYHGKVPFLGGALLLFFYTSFFLPSNTSAKIVRLMMEARQ